MSKALERSFRKSLEHRWLMRFRTRHPDGDNYDGIIVHNSQRFIALLEVTDFEFDGIIVLPKKVIRGVRDGKFERCTNEILRQNGTLRHLKAPAWIAGSATIADLLTILMKRSIWPAIETLFEDGSTAFYLGPIETLSGKGLHTRPYDAAGEWENGCSFRWSEIFKVEFGSRYCRHFNRYMRTKNDRRRPK